MNSRPDNSSEDEQEEEFSLEQLGAAYAAVAGPLTEAGSDSMNAAGSLVPKEEQELDDESLLADLRGLEESEEAATPEAIVEAALFVGHPENKPLTAARLASLMRDVTLAEVIRIVQSLNQSYRDHRQAIRISGDEDEGYQMVVAPEVESMRFVFAGKVRETRLNQASIEVLALVAYQPGITATEVTNLRGRDSVSLLNQMVRRRLLEIRREPVANSRKATVRYFPTERLVVLLGLETIEDLPRVEESPL
jgi:segregation and condensation protein B